MHIDKVILQGACFAIPVNMCVNAIDRSTGSSLYSVDNRRNPSDACSALSKDDERVVSLLHHVYMSIMCYCKSAISKCASIFAESILKELGRSGLIPSLSLHSQFSDMKENDEPSRASVGEMRAELRHLSDLIGVAILYPALATL